MTVITAILAVTNETAEKNEKMKKKKKLNLNNSKSTCPNQTLNSAKCRYWTRLLESIVGDYLLLTHLIKNQE